MLPALPVADMRRCHRRAAAGRQAVGSPAAANRARPPPAAFLLQNWGLLLFDEKRLLYNQAWEGAWGLVQAANVICHEVAHQW